MSGPAFLSAIELAEMIRSRELSARELTMFFIDRIERLDGAVNAVAVRDFDRALARADVADQALAAGRVLGPLHGVPMTIKESFDIEGLPTTFGNPEFKDNIATSDARMVERFKGAGAHFIGKPNVPIDLADLQSYNDLYGVTGNPWDTTRTAGGSSGGSAAALAAGMSALDSGSDIGGSIRNPAHFCGVYGHKPTWNVISAKGHALPGTLAASDLGVVGPMARSAGDLALAMDITAGPGPLEAPGWRLDLPRPRKSTLRQYRVVIWPSDALAPVDDAIADRIAEIGELLGRLGATVSDSARPAIDLADAIRTYKYLLHGALSARTPEPVRQHYRELAAALAAHDDSDRAITARGTVQEHAAWLEHNNARTALRYAWQRFFADWDVLICPPVASTAFAHEHGPFRDRTVTVNGNPQPYFQQLFWAGLVTGPYLPSTVFPTGVAADGLPVGAQAVSGEFNDYLTIDFCRLLARETGGFTPPPLYNN